MAKRTRRVKRTRTTKRKRSVRRVRKPVVQKKKKVIRKKKRIIKRKKRKPPPKPQRHDFLVTVKFIAGDPRGGVHRYSRSLIVPAPSDASRSMILSLARDEAPAALRDVIADSSWSRADISQGPPTKRKRSEER